MCTHTDANVLSISFGIPAPEDAAIFPFVLVGKSLTQHLDVCALKIITGLDKDANTLPV